ncbi:hypothetical protein HYS97_02145 [Candidatus Daviesbacteria bacterium]|nr:hypothetical protein [Candidatus Daviesbacteria bacterium]
MPVDDQVLSLLSLGKNINLRSYQRFSLIRQEEPTVPANLSFDLNKDGRVNSLDLSIVVQNLGKSPKVLEADINKDGIVDQKDIDLIKQNL